MRFPNQEPFDFDPTDPQIRKDAFWIACIAGAVALLVLIAAGLL